MTIATAEPRTQRVSSADIELRMVPEYYVLVEALIDGLRRTDWALNSTCHQALVALGQPAVPTIKRAASAPGVSVPHAARLAESIRAIEAGPWEPSRTVSLVSAALNLALRFPDDRLGRTAGRAANLFCPGIVDKLIIEAIYFQRKPKDCIRLLKSAEYTGETPSTDALLSLSMLETARHPGIRERAVRLIMHFRQLRMASIDNRELAKESAS